MQEKQHVVPSKNGTNPPAFSLEDKQRILREASEAPSVKEYLDRTGLKKDQYYRWKREVGVRRRLYTDQEKRSIVKAAYASGDVEAYAKASGLASSSIYRWKKERLARPAKSETAEIPWRKDSRQPLSDQEKRNIAEAAVASGSLQAYAQKVGIPYATIYGWQRKMNGRSAKTQPPKAGTSEITELRLENAVLKAMLRLAELRGFRLLEMEKDQ